METTALEELAARNGAPAEPMHSPFARAVAAHVARTVVGQDIVVERILIALLTGGHLLLEGVPGTAKTLLVKSVASAIDLGFGRIQFTIDLLPSDILGSEILDRESGAFRVDQGPVFTNLLLADEINRASPKVQSALLEAMQERRVTIGKHAFRLEAPFLVIATQNPIEQSGTFELPEAQLDRFLLRHRLNYPSADEELEVLRRSLSLGLVREGEGAVPRNAFDAIEREAPLHRRDLTSAMEEVQAVHVSEVFLQHCVDLVHRTRAHPELELGASPRAGIALSQAARARAYLYGRDYAVPEDLFALVEDVLLHRMRPTYEALSRGRDSESILADILREI